VGGRPGVGIGRRSVEWKKKSVGPTVGSPNRGPPNWGAGGEIWKTYQNIEACWRSNFYTHRANIEMEAHLVTLLELLLHKN